MDRFLPVPLFQIPQAPPEKVHPERFHLIVGRFLLIPFLFRFQTRLTLGLLLLVHQKHFVSVPPFQQLPAPH